MRCRDARQVRVMLSWLASPRWLADVSDEEIMRVFPGTVIEHMGQLLMFRKKKEEVG